MLSILKIMIPTIVTTRFRKFLHYGIFVGFLAVAGLTISMWLSRSDLQHALNASIANQEKIAEKLDHAEMVNQTQSDTILIMEKVIKSNSEIASKLNSEIGNLTASEREVRRKLAEIERANKNVQEYLNVVVPDDLRGLLNATESTSGDQNGNSVGSN